MLLSFIFVLNYLIFKKGMEKSEFCGLLNRQWKVKPKIAVREEADLN